MMPDLPPEPSIFGIKVAHLIAGGVGGIVRMLVEPAVSPVRNLATAMIGVLVAGYVTPVAAPLTVKYLAFPEIPAASVEGMMGFIIGLTGMSLCERAIKWVRNWKGPVSPT